MTDVTSHFEKAAAHLRFVVGVGVAQLPEGAGGQVGSTDSHGRAALVAYPGLTCAAESSVHPLAPPRAPVRPGAGRGAPGKKLAGTCQAIQRAPMASVIRARTQRRSVHPDGSANRTQVTAYGPWR
jgi:hypothetical protein